MADFPVSKTVEFMSKIGIKERPYKITAYAVSNDNLELNTGHGSVYLNRLGVQALHDLLGEMLGIMQPQDSPPAPEPDKKKKK